MEHLSLRNCPRCGSANSDQATTCEQCGRKLPRLRSGQLPSLWRMWRIMLLTVAIIALAPVAIDRLYPGAVTVDRVIVAMRFLLLAAVVPVLFLLRYLLDTMAPPVDSPVNPPDDQSPSENPPASKS